MAISPTRLIRHTFADEIFHNCIPFHSRVRTPNLIGRTGPSFPRTPAEDGGPNNGGRRECLPRGEAGTPAGHLTARTRQLTPQAFVRKETLLRYAPKHAATKQSSVTGRRTAGVVMASAATVGAGLATAGAAHAQSPYNVWDRVATCESTNNWAISTGNGYYGGLQFSASTWTGFGGSKYGATANLATRDQQIYIAQGVLRAQGPGAWPVCSVRAGLTRANGLAVVVDPGTGTSPTPTPPPSRGTVRKLAVDGSFGPLTIKAVQQWVGVAQTGSMTYTTRTALQRKVGATPDGDIGPKTIAALQTRIGLSHDGASSLTIRTVKALQTYLNTYVLV